MKIIHRIKAIIIALCASITLFACENVGDNDTKVSVVGTYTGAWEFDEDGNVTHDPAPYVYDTKQLTGTYKQSGKDVSITWANGTTITATCKNTGELVVNGEVQTKVDMDTLYKEFAGKYSNTDALWSMDAVHEMNFTANGDLIPGAMGSYAKYHLQPITQTHGKVHTSIVTIAGIGYLLDGEPLGEIYYTKINGNYHLRLSEGAHRYTPWGIGHGHFIDWKKRGDSYNSKDVFAKLAGDNGTVENPVSKTYASQNASLTLYNDGVLKLTRVDAQKTFLGGKAKFFDGQTEKSATYNVIALTETTGKIFIDMAELPVSYPYNRANLKNIDTTRWVVGDYTLNDNEGTITFLYKDTLYTLVTA